MTGARYFKLKLNGDPDADAARLTRIGNELATLPHDYSVTLDANEQYADLAALAALADRLDRDSALKPIATKLLYIEQPMPRDISRQSPLGALAARDFIIDEADDSYDAFPAARELGYRGISSKSCKGIYKSIINATRAAIWSSGRRKVLHHGRGPDLSGRPRRAAGPRAWRPDRASPMPSATVTIMSMDLPRRPPPRRRPFSRRIPISMPTTETRIRLSIHDGDLLTGSLTAPGFATGVHPDWPALSPLQQPKAKTLQEQSI